MKRLIAASLLGLAMPASGTGQVVRVPAPDVRVNVQGVEEVQRVQVPRPDGGPLEALVLPGRGTEIGVTIRDIDPADVDSQKAVANADVTGGAGVIVEQVRPGGPAATAGLRAADLVVSFDGEPVRSSRQFSRLVQETPPGRTVTATIVRDGRRSDISITTGGPQARRQDDRDVIFDRDAWQERFEREFRDFDRNAREGLREFNFEFPGTSARGRLGVGVDDLTAQLAVYFGAKEGVLVTTVDNDTPASKGGLKAGDVIVTFNGEAVRNRLELQRAVARAQADAEVTVGIIRERKPSDVKVKLEGPRRTTRRQA